MADVKHEPVSLHQTRALIVRLVTAINALDELISSGHLGEMPNLQSVALWELRAARGEALATIEHALAELERLRCRLEAAR